PIEEVQARLLPGQRVRLRVLAKGGLVPVALGGFTWVSRVERTGGEGEDTEGTFEVTYDGDAWRLSELVAAVTTAGIPLVGVEPERRDLERLFMDLTVPANVTGGAG